MRVERFIYTFLLTESDSKSFVYFYTNSLTIPSSGRLYTEVRAGNLYSLKQEVIPGSAIRLNLTERFPERSLIDHALVEEFSMQSDTLTAWWDSTMMVLAILALLS